MSKITAGEMRKKQATEAMLDKKKKAAIEAAAKEAHQKALAAAHSSYKSAMHKIYNKIKKTPHTEQYCIVQKREGYHPELDALNPAHAIMGEPRKDRSLRRRPSFPETDSWKYIAQELEGQGFEVSFEKSITTLDERGRSLYLLVAYWD